MTIAITTNHGLKKPLPSTDEPMAIAPLNDNMDVLSRALVAGSTMAQGVLTADAPVIHTATWNNGAVPFTAHRINITDTASGAGSLLFDLQVGGSTRFSVRKDGAIPSLTVLADNPTFNSKIVQTAAWTDFTPTLTQNGGAVSHTVTWARYAIVGKIAYVKIRFAVTGAGAAGIVRVESIPAAIAPRDTDASAGTAVLAGGGLIFDTSATQWSPLVVAAPTATTFYFWGPGVQTAQWGTSPSTALASGDVVSLDVSYEIAS